MGKKISGIGFTRYEIINELQGQVAKPVFFVNFDLI